MLVHLRRSSLLAVFAVLTACADGTGPRELAAPDAAPAFALEAQGGDGIFSLMPADAPADFARAERATERAATGGRSGGHAAIRYLSSSQSYTFTGLSTARFPAAKGTVHASIVGATVSMDFDVEVDCLLTVGNEAWVSGPVTRFVLNGVERTARIHLLFRVQDNGEGAGSPPDLVSPPFGAGPRACLLASALPLLPNGGGNVQVVGR